MEKKVFIADEQTLYAALRIIRITWTHIAAPKIFFRYYFVNSSTGEKSGTMLAECKWTAAAAEEGGGD